MEVFVYHEFSLGKIAMTQELWDLRKSILDGRYDDALVIVDDLELMSQKSYIRNKSVEC
ncbi:hypothetical protein KBT16_05685 [Nostoc sp. CCCryo 231-06]|nr:hypothetical protein [Nostoc sp. CCCryo 231-06]